MGFTWRVSDCEELVGCKITAPLCSTSKNNVEQLQKCSVKLLYPNNLGVHIGVYQPCPALKRTLVAMSDRTGMSVSQVTDEVLYTGLVEMQEL